MVESKWDIIALLCLLVFFLATSAVTYAVIRPEGIVRKVIALAIAFPLGYGVAYVSVHEGLAPEFYRMACGEMMDRLKLSEAQAKAQCGKRNPIHLSRVKRK